MAKIKEEKVQEISSNEELENLLKAHKESHFAFLAKGESNTISTGSLQLDSLVKIKSGSIVRLVGKGAELGKTSECLVLASNYMKVMPKSKTIFVKAEGRLSEEMQRRSGEKFVTDSKEWEYGTIFVFPCNVFQVVAQFIETLVKSMYEKGEHLCIIIDSLDGLILREDLEKDVWGGKESPKVAGAPLLTKLLFKRLSLPINYYKALLLITGQYSVDIKLDPYSPNVPRQAESSGGNAIAHQSDYVFSYAPRFFGDMILKDPDEKYDLVKNPIIGVFSTIEIKKSGTDVSGNKVKIPIKKGVVGCAIWKSKEVGDLLLAWDLVARQKPWFIFEPEVIKEAAEKKITVPEKVKGMNGYYTFLEENKEVCDYFYEKFKQALA